MPVTGLPSGNDWLQSLLASLGAGQPYSPGAQPSGAGPQGLMPGGGALGYAAATPGQPSMGYPATSGPPAASTAQPGLSLGGVHAPVSAGNDGGFNNPYQAAANAPALPMMPPRTPTPAAPATAAPAGYLNPTLGNVDARGAPYPATSDGGLAPYLGNVDARGAPYPTTRAGGAYLDPYLGSTDARGAPYPAGVGAPQGNPSQTPRPRPNLGRYGTVQYQTPNSVGSRAPIYTALNLFGRG